MKLNLSIIFFLLLQISYAQKTVVEAGYSNKILDEVTEQISRLEPEFQKYPSKDAALELANSFLYIRKYKKAISYFEYATSLSALDEKQTTNYFNALFEFGDIRTATEVAKDFYTQFGKMTLKARIDSFENMGKPNTVVLENLTTMNSDISEYGMYPLFADYFILNSDINVKEVSKDVIEYSNGKFIKPFVVSIVDTLHERPRFYPIIKNENFINSITHYDPKRKEVYITRNSGNIFNLGSESTMKIYSARINSYLKLDELVDFKYNSTTYSVGQPCMTKDGQVLYFSSDMPGGFGGTDLYRCMRMEDGSWGMPINLGNVVNTPQDEMFPFITAQGNTLYFASTGHSIFGGFDINKAHKTRAFVFSKPINLGAPFNSVKDDFAVIFTDALATEGYLSSNRAEGLGGVDIYRFSYEKKTKETVSEEESTKKPATIIKLNSDKIDLAPPEESAKPVGYSGESSMINTELNFSSTPSNESSSITSSSSPSNGLSIDENSNQQAKAVEGSSSQSTRAEGEYLEFNR